MNSLWQHGISTTCLASMTRSGGGYYVRLIPSVIVLCSSLSPIVHESRGCLSSCMGNIESNDKHVCTTFVASIIFITLCYLPTPNIYVQYNQIESFFFVNASLYIYVKIPSILLCKLIEPMSKSCQIQRECGRMTIHTVVEWCKITCSILKYRKELCSTHKDRRVSSRIIKAINLFIY